MNVEPVKDIVGAGLLALLIIATLSVVGAYLLACLRARRLGRGVGAVLTLATVIGIGWPLQAMGVPLRVIGAGVLIAAISGLLLLAAVPQVRSWVNPRLIVGSSDAWFIAVALVFALVFVYPAIREFGLTFASLGNGDPLNYALQAEQTLGGGFSRSTGVLNWDLGFDARYGWSGAATSIGLLASITGRTPGTVLIVATVVFLVLAQWQTSVLIRELIGPKRECGRRSEAIIVAMTPFAAALAWLNPFSAYIAGNGFLAQLLGMTLATSLAVILLRVVTGSGFSMGTAILSGLIAGAAISCYGALAPLLIVLIVVSAGIAFVWSRGRDPWWSRVRWGAVGTAALITIVTSTAGILWFSYDGVLVTTSLTAGWPMHVPSPGVLFGLEQFIDAGGAAVPASVMWLLAVPVVAAIAGNLTWRDARARMRLTLGAAVILVMVAGTVVFGTDAYRAWKLWGLLVPTLVAVTIASLVWMATRLIATKWKWTGLGIAAVALALLALNGTRLSTNLWELSPYTYGASGDQVSLTMNPNVRSEDGVNVGTPNPIENMLLLIYAGSPSRLATGPSFYPELPPRFAKTVVRNDQLTTETRRRATALNGTYALIDTTE